MKNGKNLFGIRVLVVGLAILAVQEVAVGQLPGQPFKQLSISFVLDSFGKVCPS